MELLKVNDKLIETGIIADEMSSRYQVIPDIHKDDFIFQCLYHDFHGQNLREAVEKYFLIGDVNSKKVGELAVELLKERPDEAILTEAISILDFASGYGCVSRFIPKVFPKAAFSAIDIHDQAVDFHRRRLGLDAELSNTDPELLKPHRQYDVVFALSFFSHLPRTTFHLWLKALLNYVKQNGILIFTTHGRASHRLMSGITIDHEGYGFAAISEQKDLSTDTYGMAITYPEYVLKKLGAIENAELVYLHHAFWWTHQDCFVVRKREDRYMRLPESRCGDGFPNDASFSLPAQSHLAKIKAHFDQTTSLSAQAISYRRLLARYFNLLIPEDASVLEVGCGSGELLACIKAKSKTGIDLSEDQIKRARHRAPDADFIVADGETLDMSGRHFDYIILSDTVNLAGDVQRLFERLRSVSQWETRLILNFHSNLWKPLVWLSTFAGLRRKQPECNWLTREDVVGLLKLSDWELIRFESRLLLPIRMFGLETLINRWIAPILSPFCLVNFAIARPTPRSLEVKPKTVSVVIPARNEAGNIESALARTPDMGEWTELIFVEGHSKDNTWEEIERVAKQYEGRRIKIHRQSGKGKGNAVREGFDLAGGELLMILDADLTMPPEELPKFYEAVVSRKCEFANGSRLVYPMEQRAMRFLNMCANKGFSLVFSWLLGQPVKDTLCGTKVMMAEAYKRMAANRSYFGEFDPFGDFDLLFGASKLNLKILDIPIRYRERVYGDTNIQRWRHGVLLLRMVLFAARKLKFV